MKLLVVVAALFLVLFGAIHITVADAPKSFKDCEVCPEVVVVPAGRFMMGAPFDEKGRSADEGPQHLVTIDYSFAAGKYEVTFEQWDACVDDGGCSYRVDDKGWGRGKSPVINVSWEDAQTYVRWLSRKTGALYRLLSEAEWEYAARAGAATPFSSGTTIRTDQANYDGTQTYGGSSEGVARKKTVPVGSFPPNAFGLHEMHGNVWEWVEDCWNGTYMGAPDDGAAWTTGDCQRRVLRGGSWSNAPDRLRSANRGMYSPIDRNSLQGFRVARTLQ